MPPIPYARSKEIQYRNNGLTIEPIVPYYAKWIREGKLKPSSDWNKDLKINLRARIPVNRFEKALVIH